MPRKPTVVLSIDWDYFFPDQDVYDWGHAETGGLFFEFIWTTRPDSRNLMDRNAPAAIDAMWPEGHENFWYDTAVVAREANPRQLLIAESHRSMLDFVQGKKNLVIHNVDAHHDLGYSAGDDGSREPDCGNWAATLIRQGRVAEYHQHYPTWRKDVPEFERSFPQAKMDFQLPTGLKPDMVFVCRSSCWCPPWADGQWMSFVAGLTLRFRKANCRAVQYVTTPRSFDEKAAREMVKQREALNAMLPMLQKLNKA